MAEIKQLRQITTLPGVRRDGTNLDADFYTEGQWVRFQRGKPRKMGGFQRISNRFSGPIRSLLVWSRGLMNAVYAFSYRRIQLVLVDGEGLGGTAYDRTPAGFTPDVDHIWSTDTMYDDAVGSRGTIVVAVATLSLSNIDDENLKQVYFGLANDTTPFTPITGLQVSGGIVCIAPYLVYFGSDGLVGWSDINQPQTLTGGDAGQDRVTGAKIVAGLPLRTGSGPSALLWSLDSVIQMTYIGGSAIFRFSTVTAQSSILSQNGVIEYDGDYFWVGIDRFLVYSGGRVQELPNDQNLNWFFDNLNFAQRQKVWAMKVPRYGEIHWYFPYDDAEECTHCVIYNVREKTWYDNQNPRSSGFYSQVFKYPVMSGSVPRTDAVRAVVSGVSGTFSPGDTLSTNNSGLGFTLLELESPTIFILQPNFNPAQEDPIVGETVSDTTSGATALLAGYENLFSIYIHEKGLNRVEGETESAIESFFETSDFGYPTGGAQQNQIEGINRWTRVVRVEPDFVMSGDMTLEVIGREFAQSTDVASSVFTFDSTTGKIDIRDQRRQVRLRFTSNTLGGNYQMGRVILHLEPGDVRS